MMLTKVLAEFEKVKNELSITDDEFLRCCYKANMIVARKDEHSKALQYWYSKVNELLGKDSQGRLELELELELKLRLTVDDLLIIAMVKELA